MATTKTQTTKSTVPVNTSEKGVTQTPSQLFGKENYKWMIIGLVVLAIMAVPCGDQRDFNFANH